jgi:hypothetical protein
LHDASKTILDVALDRCGPLEQTLHLSHPRPVSWTSIFEAISTAMMPVTGGKALPLVPFSDWFGKLESCSMGDMERIPGLKLLSFFRKMSIADDELRIAGAGVTHIEAGGLVMLSTDKIQRVSKTAQEIPSLSVDDADRWVRYWRSAGLFGRT